MKPTASPTTSPTASLPPCARRWWFTAGGEKRFACKPPSQIPEGLPFRERMLLLVKRDVTCEDCLACAVREPIEERPLPDPSVEPVTLEDGTLVYKPVPGQEPPPVPPGFARKGTEGADAWAFVCVNRCPHFALVYTPAASGCTNCGTHAPHCTRNGESRPLSQECQACPDNPAIAPPAIAQPTVRPPVAPPAVEPDPPAPAREPGPPRPDLVRLQDTLIYGKSLRKFRFEEDGGIVYEREADEWEPPRQINGYERDHDDKWRFHPLWPVCILRHGILVGYPNCGCLEVIMRCNCPQAAKFTERLRHTDCEECPHRKKG